MLEPPRPKTHWDYLLEEMAWLAQDFAHERKWKKQAAKRCARMVQKHFQDRALAAQKAERARELQLRRIAAFAAREIRSFWSNVEKVSHRRRDARDNVVTSRVRYDQLYPSLVDSWSSGSGRADSNPLARRPSTSNSTISSIVPSATPVNSPRRYMHRPPRTVSDHIR